MIRRLLNLLLAALLFAAGPAGAFAAALPQECCCGEACPCPPPSRPAPRAPLAPTAPVVNPEVQTRAVSKPHGRESKLGLFEGGVDSKRIATPLPAQPEPDPPDASKRQALLAQFLN